MSITLTPEAERLLSEQASREGRPVDELASALLIGILVQQDVNLPEGSYPIWSPYGSYDAARMMEELIRADESKQ